MRFSSQLRDELLAHGVEDVQHHEGLITDASVAVCNICGNTIEVLFLHDSLLVPDPQQSLTGIYHADLFVGVRMRRHSVAGQCGVENHHHVFAMEAGEDSRFESGHLNESAGVFEADEVRNTRSQTNTSFSRGSKDLLALLVPRSALKEATLRRGGELCSLLSEHFKTIWKSAGPIGDTRLRAPINANVRAKIGAMA